ncbi:MAG: acyl-CoA thioesterase II [Gemmatimonadetes bacterium]|nr:acyl-CoA thioesterase II [Gemmatimonadota bacterium]
MPDLTESLIALLDLEPIERNIYRGENRDIGSGRIFGGQVLAQALVAARRTIPEEDREAHSLHGYFILEGDLSTPVVYFVDRTRDGRSFTTRRVTAIQHGRAIFTLSASFHRTESGPSHQSGMPPVAPPEGLPSELEILRDQSDRIPEELRTVLTQDRPLEFRPVEPYVPFDRTRRPAVRHIWLRATEALGDNPVHHQAALAYASDYGILSTALQPHGRTVRDKDLMAASLDHSLWFHRPFRADEWLLYRIQSPVAHGARGFGRGTFHTRDGELVASAAQEGLLRTGIKPRGKRPPPVDPVQ